MSKFMLIAGILCAALAVAMGLMLWQSPGKLLVYGVTGDTPAILFAGGLIMLGLGGTIAAMEKSAAATGDLRHWLAGHETAAMGTAAVVAAKAAEEAVPPEPPKPTTEETIAALDKANKELSTALGLDPEPPPPPKTEEAPPKPLFPEIKSVEIEARAEAKPEPEPDPAEAEAAEEESDENLFVVDEKVIRGRPARVLSDGTVEAETNEGWMRFENLEHLEEYLDATEPDKA